MRRLLSIDGHEAASIPCAFDRRWPWLKRQVDRPSGEEQSRPPHNTPKARGPPRKKPREWCRSPHPTDGEGPCM
eukprot:scaffold10354_cov68-Cyclotella_meneghiniana.AAC.2